MRTIKFRFRLKELTSDGYQEWFEFATLDELIRGGSIVGTTAEIIAKDLFTGLLDKNGKEIYEGDVVFHEDGEYSWYAVVRWDEHDLYFYADLYHTNEPLQTEFVEAELEVIGNIYENPDLIK
jgi:uncharacterized phage protein (TIGR01671 family)